MKKAVLLNVFKSGSYPPDKNIYPEIDKVIAFEKLKSYNY